MTDRHLTEFRERWQDIRASLEHVQVGNISDIIALIRLEAARVSDLPPETAAAAIVENTTFADAKDSTTTDREWVGARVLSGAEACLFPLPEPKQ